MDEANLREWEIMAASRAARLYLLSWNVACVLAGPRTKNGARSNQAKEFENFCTTWGRIIAFLCMQEFTWSNLTETTDCHQVFATPPCPEQRRLAIVVAAAFRKCIVGQREKQLS